MYTSQPNSVFRSKTAKGQAILRSHYLGPHPILHHYLERMNLRDIVCGCLGFGSRGGAQDSLTHAQALEVLVHNILVSPVPLYRLSDWVAPIEASALGLTEDQKKAVNDDRIARTLEALASSRGRNLFFRLALQILKEFSLRTDRIHFDTTTVTFYGEYATSVVEPAIRHGHNKDHRPDLKQLVFGLNVTSDGAVPLAHRVWSGNRTDDTLHLSNIEMIRHLLGREDFIYVADSKLCTKHNLRLINSAGGKFVTVLARSRKEDKDFREHLRAVGVRWRFLLKIPSKRRLHDPPDVFSTCKAPTETTLDGYRLVWVRSSRKAELDKAAREAGIKKAFAELEYLSRRINRGKLKTRATIRKAVDSSLKQNGVAKFIQVRIRSRTEIESRFLRRGRPRKGDPVRKVRKRIFALEVHRRKDRLQAEARIDGVFPIVSNLREAYGKRDLLMIYKYQPYVEKRFSGLKSEFRVAPVFLKKPARVAGMIHAYFVAIVLSSLIERNVRMNMKRKEIHELPLFPEERMTKTPTCPRALEPFTGLIWFDFEQGNNLVSFPLKLDKLQKELLSLMEVPREVYA